MTTRLLRLVPLTLAALASPAAAQQPATHRPPVQVQIDVTVLAVSDAAFREAAKDVRPYEGCPSLPAPSEVKSGSYLLPDAQALALVRRIREGGNAHVLAEPKLIALSGRSATFVGSSPGVQLTFLPIVMPDRRIYLESSLSCGECRTQPVPEVSDDETPDAGPTKSSTAVMMPAGRTMVLYGGSFERSAELPVLGGKTPYVNKLFKLETAHVLFLVTPRVITPMDSGAGEEAEAPPARPERGVEEQAEAELAKLLERYHRACAEGRVAAARVLAEQCLNLDPTCFSKK